MRYLTTLCCFLCLLIATGCSHPSVHATGFLSDYDSFNAIDESGFKLRLTEEQDKSIDQYFLTKPEQKEYTEKHQTVPNAEADGVNLEDARPVLFIVAKPVWRAPIRLKVEEEDEVLFTVRERLYRYLLRAYPHPVRVRYAYTPGDPLTKNDRVLTVSSAVTDIKKGSGFWRYVIGYGVGAVELQLEGQIIEGPEEGGGKVVGEYAIRKRHGGYPNGFLNPSVMQVPYCLKYAAEAAIDELAKGIRKSIPAAEPSAPKSDKETLDTANPSN